MLMVSGSGSTQLYEECTTSTCSGAGGGPVYNATCPYTMADWMAKAVKVFDVAGPCFQLLLLHTRSPPVVAADCVQTVEVALR